jgi:hypothetical protein
MKELGLIEFDDREDAENYCDSLRENYKITRLEEDYELVITAYTKKNAYQVFFTTLGPNKDEPVMNMIIGQNIEKMLEKILEIRKLKKELRKERIEEYLEILEK